MTREEAIKVIEAAPYSPALKRKILAKAGLVVEYQPHQGKREMERRRKKLQKAA